MPTTCGSSLERTGPTISDKHFSEERLAIAQRHLLSFLKVDDLKGKSFLDIGCGSGIHSLAAWRSGARPLFSFDYDRQSVATTKLLRKRKGDPPEFWTVIQGSLSRRPKAFVQSSRCRRPTWSTAGQCCITRARCGTRSRMRAPGSTRSELVYIALYASDAFTDPTPEDRLNVKREYNRAPLLKKRWMDWQYAWNHSIRHELRARRNPLTFDPGADKKSRGISAPARYPRLVGRVSDGVRGEQGDQEIFCRERLGLSLVNIKAGEANTEFLFRRTGASNYWDEVLGSSPLVDLPGPFEHVQGFSWRAKLPPALSDESDPARLMLYENGVPVGWPRQPYDHIAVWGRGRYGADRESIVFSATDNGDPNGADQRYQFRINFY